MPDQEKQWEDWKDSLARMVNIGSKMGLGEKTINNLAYRLGNWLAEHIDPGSREQRVIKELWDVAGEDERRVLAALIAIMVSDGRRQEDMVH
ncbi:MAG: DUF3243 domain-containing protein [Moorella sp. (in: firmicutes)]